MAANYVLLERIELAASAASLIFANIPQSGYTDLKVVVSARTGRTSSQQDALLIRFNGDTTSGNYSGKRIYGTGSSAASDNEAFVYASGNLGTANVFSNSELYIPNYLGSNQKSWSADSALENNATAAWLFMDAGKWTGTAAINSITLTPDIGPNFLANSTFSLYGLAAVGTTPAIAPKASGGNITTDGTYWIHTFNSSGYFVPQTPLNCDYLVVAGGGGGGSWVGGGGGAGGYRYSTAYPVSTSATVTVGAGGIGNVSSTVPATNGNDSIFSGITSAGGGGGGGLKVGPSGATVGLPGGSGGGGRAGLSGGAASPAGQGYAGGTGESGGSFRGGGGGGASAAGADGTVSGNGGNGLANSITGTSVTYAGGGGGGGIGNYGTGGSGGGGTGTETAATGGAGTANLGGGGGGGGYDSEASNGYGGNGGSGIVIIRYPIA